METISFIHLIGIGLAGSLFNFFALWLISLKLRDSSIVDIYWGMNFLFLAWFYSFLEGTTHQPISFIANILVSIYGLRLSLHIFIRNWRKGEDARYQKFRNDSGNRYWWVSLFKVFFLQAFLNWLVAIPLAVIHYYALSPTNQFLIVLGLLSWLIGFWFESIGDWQLLKFKRDPQNHGKIFDQGLWKYTRHPNYFGEAVIWWGYYFAAAAYTGYWSVFSPILMTWLLVRVSGAKLLEENLTKTKPGYKEYIERTSGFIPWFPRR